MSTMGTQNDLISVSTLADDYRKLRGLFDGFAEKLIRFAEEKKHLPDIVISYENGVIKIGFIGRTFEIHLATTNSGSRLSGAIVGYALTTLGKEYPQYSQPTKMDLNESGSVTTISNTSFRIQNSDEAIEIFLQILLHLLKSTSVTVQKLKGV